MASLYKSLEKHGFSVGALHGDMDQSARTAALDQFRKGEIPLLVASDVAARGLDIPAVSHVFNFDVPHHADDYVHRIGRTGRAGRAGTAISLVTPLDQKSMVAIEKLIGQSIPRSEGSAEVQPMDGTAAPASIEAERPRQLARTRRCKGRHKARLRAQESARRCRRRRRKPRRERGPRRAGRGPQVRPAATAPAAAFTPPTAPPPSRTPSIGRAEAPQTPVKRPPSLPIIRIFRRSCCDRSAPASDSGEPVSGYPFTVVHSSSLNLAAIF